MKKLRPRSQPRSRPVSSLDEALDSCTHISTLAGLLGACGKARTTEKLEVELVAAAGWMIFDETQRLRKLLSEVRHQGQV